jgi:Zn-dependent membrane protease YugP
VLAGARHPHRHWHLLGVAGLRHLDVGHAGGGLVDHRDRLQHVVDLVRRELHAHRGPVHVAAALEVADAVLKQDHALDPKTNRLCMARM